MTDRQRLPAWAMDEHPRVRWPPHVDSNLIELEWRKVRESCAQVTPDDLQPQ